MVGCFGRAIDSSEPIRLDLDNELEDAQWFSKAELARLVATPKGSELTKADLKLLDKDAPSTALANSDRDTANALAPSEGVVKPETEQAENKGLTRVPPATAIAGMLVRTWVNGGVDMVQEAE
jgi:NAD+ diphosphatase